MCATLDEKMETKLSTVKPPRLLPGAAKVADARPKRRTKVIAVIKPKPKFGIVQSKMKTKPSANKGLSLIHI